MKRIGVLLTLVLVAALLTACGEPTERAAEVAVRIGVDPNYPPLEWIDDSTGQLTGFDIELMNLICERNGWVCEYAVLPFERLLDSVHARSLDMAVSAISITSQRRASVLFSDPYCLTGQTITVHASDSATRDLNDLRGRRVGALTGSTSETLAKSVDGVQVFPYRELREAFAALAAGELEAVINDAPNTRALISDHPQLIVLPTLLDSEYYGIALPLDDLERCRQINLTLATMMGDGAFDSLHHRWFGRSAFEDSW